MQAEKVSTGPANPLMINTRNIALLIDHTLLKPGATVGDIEKLCREARRFGFCSVCVNSANIFLCKKLLKGSAVKICSVVGFPLGAASARSKAFEAGDAARAGAAEIDMVINIGALKSGNDSAVLEDIRAVREASRGRVLKVIIEAGLLTRRERIKACLLAKKAGAEFVKTSTGFVSGSAARDVRLMRKTVGQAMGVKAAGGIKTAEQLFEMIKAGASRIGTSSGTSIMKQIRISNSKVKKD